MDPQQQPSFEPTPSSPAPVQTSPVTPPQTQLSPHGSRLSVKALVAAIIAAVILVGGLVFLLLSPWSPLVGSVPSGPKLLVGNHEYVYACPVIDQDLVSKQLDITRDSNKEGVSESNAYDPANSSKDKQEDITKATGSEQTSSNCTLKLDRVQSGSGDSQRTSFINVAVSIGQYADDKKAGKAFQSDQDYQGEGTKSLPSFSGKSFYSAPRALYNNVPVTLEPEVLHNNLVIRLSVPTGSSDKTGEQNAAKLDPVVKDILARIDRGEGLKPKNFNGSNQLNGHSFADSCASVNYAKVAGAMGSNTQFNAETVSGNQAYAPDNNKGQTPNQLISACTLTFRTQSEIDSANNVKKDQLGETGLGYGDKFPHYLTLQIAVTSSKGDAQKFLARAKSQAENNAKKKTTEEDKASVEDARIGDGAIKVSLSQKYAPKDPSQSQTSTSGRLYYITKGPNVYIISTTYVQQDKPIASQARELTTDQAQRIFKELTLASRRAN